MKTSIRTPPQNQTIKHDGFDQYIMPLGNTKIITPPPYKSTAIFKSMKPLMGEQISFL